MFRTAPGPVRVREPKSMESLPFRQASGFIRLFVCVDSIMFFVVFVDTLRHVSRPFCHPFNVLILLDVLLCYVYLFCLLCVEDCHSEAEKPKRFRCAMPGTPRA